MLARLFMLLFVIPSLVLAQEAPDPTPTGGQALSRQVAEAFQQQDYTRAQTLLKKQLETGPRDPFITYNLACAQSMGGDTRAAAETLIDAVAFGFSDFFHMERDPHLDPVRQEPSYRALRNGWPKVLNARGEADLKGARQLLGAGYVYEQDPALRVNFASAMPPDSFVAAKRELVRTAEWSNRFLALGGSADPDRPDPWVTLILPTPEDFSRFIAQEGVGGYYDKDRKRLIVKDIGATLRHEFFHALHWRDMDRRGQKHPYWVMEGLAALLEDVEDEGENFRLVPSWRTNIVKRLARSSRLIRWPELFAMEREAFTGPRARANYAQSRAIFMFLHDRGVLEAWYRQYTSEFDQDPSGARAMERVFDKPLKTVEAEFKAWIAEVPMAGEQNHPGDADLGVSLAAGAGDGPVVAEVVAASRAKSKGEERLRMRDVITAVEGRPTRSLDEFHRVLAEYKVGDEVTLDVRRGVRTLRIRVELVPRAAELP